MFKKKIKRIATVVFKETIKANLLNGVIETRDFLYKNVDYNKVMEYLTMANVSFTVGFNGCSIIKDYDYIEVYGPHLLEIDNHDKNDEIKENIEYCVIKKARNDK